MKKAALVVGLVGLGVLATIGYVSLASTEPHACPAHSVNLHMPVVTFSDLEEQMNRPRTGVVEFFSDTQDITFTLDGHTTGRVHVDGDSDRWDKVRNEVLSKVQSLPGVSVRGFPLIPEPFGCVESL